MRTAQLDNSRIDACRLSAGHLRRNGVGQHHPQAVLYLMQYAADLGAEDEAVAGQRCRHQARPLLSEAGKLLELPAHLRIGTVAAGSKDDTLAGTDGFARTQHDASYSPVFDSKAFHVLIGQHRHAASTKRLQEMTDQAQPLAAHVLPLALTDEVLVPMRKAVDASPCDLFFGRHKRGHVIGHRDAFAPVTEVEARDQVGLDRPPGRVRARRRAVIMIGQTADHVKPDAASFKEFYASGERSTNVDMR